MGLRKKNKVSAQFSMSSLTDIIFLLLIFFMLTSSLVAPNALNLKLPGKSQSNPAPGKDITSVTVNRAGQFYVDRVRISKTELSGRMRNLARKARGEKAKIIIAPVGDAPTEAVATVMDFAMRYNLDAIMELEK